MERKNNLKLENVVISLGNVRDLGEMLAVKSLKIMMRFLHHRLDDLYCGLVRDCRMLNIRHENPNYRLSDGYDIAQESILFLVGQLGKRLGDTYKIDRQGRRVNVLAECLRANGRYVLRNYRQSLKTCSFDALVNTEKEPIVILIEQEENAGDILCDLIDKMNLSKVELDTINCYLAGMTYLEIADFLAVERTTIWYRKQRIKEKYIKAFAVTAY